jgi:hypothetical protein
MTINNIEHQLMTLMPHFRLLTSQGLSNHPNPDKFQQIGP